MFGRMFELDVFVLCCKFQRVPVCVNACDVNLCFSLPVPEDFVMNCTQGFCE